MDGSITRLMQGPHQQDPPSKKARRAVLKDLNDPLRKPTISIGLRMAKHQKNPTNRQADEYLPRKNRIPETNWSHGYDGGRITGIQEGRLEFDKAPLAYKDEACKYLLRHVEEIAQLSTSLHGLHKYYKIETSRKEQIMFRVRVSIEIFCHREETIWVFWDCLFNFYRRHHVDYVRILATRCINPTKKTRRFSFL